MSNGIRWSLLALFLAATRHHSGFAQDPVDSFPTELSSVAIDHDGAIWVGAQYSGLFRLHNGRLWRYDSSNTEIPDSGIAAIMVDRERVKWIATTRGFLIRFDGSEWKIISKLGSFTKAAIVQGPMGDIWVWTNQQIFQVKDGKVVNVSLDDKTNGIRIHALDFDAPGQPWIATSSGLLKRDGDLWTPVEQDVSKREMTAIAINRKSGHIICGNNEGIFEFDGTKWTALADAKHEQFRSPVRWISHVGTDECWAGCGPRGSQILSLRNKRVKTILAESQVMSDEVTDVAVGGDAQIWFTGRRSGLRLVDSSRLMQYPAAKYDIQFRARWWRTSLIDLQKEDTQAVSLDEIMTNPRQYQGKQIRFTCKIESSFEYAAIVDPNGKKHPIWPAIHPHMGIYYREKRIPLPTQPDGNRNDGMSPLVELSGFLEFGSYFGHMGGWSHQFCITDVVPVEASEAQKAQREQFKEWLRDESPRMPLAASKDSSETKQTQKALTGTWKLAAATERGTRKQVDEEIQLLFSGQTVQISSKNQKIVGKLILDANRPVPAMDFHFDDQKVPDERQLFIYRLKGDTLTLCNLGQHKRRPDGFELIEGEPKEIMEFQRINSEDKEPHSEDTELTDLILPKELIHLSD